MLILDTEVYSNYFLLSFLDVETKTVTHFEMYEGHRIDVTSIKTFMVSDTAVGFNIVNFDLPIIVQAIRTGDCANVKKLCDEIIKTNLPSYTICKQYGITVPKSWNHIDIMDVAPGISSLKIYGGRLHAPTIQDLPIAPHELIAPEQRKTMRDYCENDLHTTLLLYQHLLPQIELREKMSEQVGMDLRSKGDAQIAELVIKNEVSAITGVEYRAPVVADGFSFKYQDPGIVSFKTKQLQNIFSAVLSYDFTLGAAGAVTIPAFLRDFQIEIGKSKYQMGIGGLHSCEKSQCVRASNTHLLLDFDVASYYPNIILQQRLAPKSMGAAFLKVYRSLVERRIKAKRTGNKVAADVLKIVVNSSFGKLGSKYSPLFAPELLIQVTITGQLALLMLIERFEAAGIGIVSANTDGIVLYCPVALEKTAEEIAFDWTLDTSFELERTDYKLLASRDVNNYLAVTLNGKTKGKGVFASGGLAKNPDRSIVTRAVAEYLSHGTPVADTVNNSKDIREFVTVRKVAGGAKWREEYLGRAVRFYSSNTVPLGETIRYAKNSNKVPNSGGCRPLMTLPDAMPSDVHFEIYIAEAQQLMRDCGI